MSARTNIIHLVDWTVWNNLTGTTEVWRFTEARDGYRQGATQWLPNLIAGPVLGQHLCGDSLGSPATLEVGDLSIITTSLPRGPGNARFPDDYSFEGHPVVIRRGTVGTLPASMTIVVNGLCNEVQPQKTRLTGRISGREARYDQPLAPTYAGTGGVEGGADRTGRPLPFGVGSVDGVEGDYLGLVGGLHAWRLAPSLADVRAGWVGCSALTKVTGTPSTGQFSVTAATGLVQVGGAALAGFPYTWDVDYDPAGARSIAHALQKLALRVPGTSIRPGAVTALAASLPDEIGWCWTGDVTVRQALTDLASRSLCWWLEDAAGLLDMGALAIPAGAVSVAAFDRQTIVRGSARLSSGWPSAGGLIPSRIDLAYGWCPRVHSAQEVQGAADASRRTYATLAWRQAGASLSGPAGARPAAQPLLMETPLRSAAAAATEAARRAAFGPVRFLDLRVLGDVVPRGSIVTVTLDYPGLRSPKKARILSVVPRPRGGAADYRLWVSP